MYKKYSIFAVQLNLFAFLFHILLSINTALAQSHCKTPTGLDGACVPYAECPFIKKQFEHRSTPPTKEERQFIYDSRCTGTKSGIHLCCHDITTDGQIEYVPNLNSKGLQILDAQSCGKSYTDRVAHGEETKLAEFPWMALLKYDTPSQEFKCGGTLITNRHVLTAAHCFVNVQDQLIGVRLGEHDTSKARDCEVRGDMITCSPSAEDFGIENKIAHPQYSLRHYVNDIALIKLDRVVSFRREIHPICLPITQRTREPLPQYIIAGWGTTEEGVTSNVLRKAVVPFKTLNTCQDIYSRVRITDRHICVGGEDYIDTCKGDSGGPLFYQSFYKLTPRYVQYGIVSFGSAGCGRHSGRPGVYSNIATLLPWVTENLD